VSSEIPSGAPGFWTFDRIADALTPLASTNLPRGGRLVSRVWTDTRSILPGDLFVALRGERFDAHDFIRDAVANGAAAVVISGPASRIGDLGVPVFPVSDTLVALGALATYRRQAWGRPVVCIAGSNGKTSTKELLKAALGSRFEVHATSGNLNNLVGVPMTLLAVPDAAEVAVIEIGTNQPGEVGRLRAVARPDATVITCVGEEHLEGLVDLAGVLREEVASLDGVDLAVVPVDQPDLVAAARARASRVITAGLEQGDLRATSSGVEEDGTGWLMIDECRVHLPLRGRHNLRNAMLALAVAREFQVPVGDAARGIATMTAPPMRVAWEQHDRVTLINDAYNANPGSVRAAIDLLTDVGAGRQRAAILGSMLELGAHADRLHDALAIEVLRSPVEVIGAVGAFGSAFDRVARGDPRVVTGDEADAVWERLASRLATDAVILLKGSRGIRLERLVPAIAAWARGGA